MKEKRKQTESYEASHIVRFEKNGITLIALVVTIVILLILAGVSLNLALGSNGIVMKASEAKAETNHSLVYETIQMKSDEYSMDLENEEKGDLLAYLQWNQIINDNNEVNVEVLIGKKLSTGNGSGNRDVYVVEENTDDNTYELVYKKHENIADRNLGVIGYEKIGNDDPSDSDIFDFDPITGSIALKNAQSYYTDHCTGDGQVTRLKKIVVPAEIDGVTVKKVGGVEKIHDSGTTWEKRYSIGFQSPYVEEVVLPTTITSIENNAFCNCTNLKKVNIPNTITSIDYNAFCNCTNLKKVNIPNSVTSIGNSAFSGCTGLTSITIPDSITSIGSSTFYECTGLTSITIPDSITIINRETFFGCTDLTSVIIPNTVTKISDTAFSNCSGLTNITIPNSVTIIENYAFSNCSGLTSITIPNGVISIGYYAFGRCSGLTSIRVDENNTVYDSRDNCNALIEKSTNELMVGCKNTTIPNSVTSIGNSAFNGCTGLTSVTIPDSVTKIGESAFRECIGLTSVTIPNSVTKIGRMAFYECVGLTNITIPNSVTDIGSEAFFKCTELANIVVDENNTVYDSRDNCNAVIEKNTNKLVFGCKNTTIPNNVTSIGDSAFYGCTGLTSITIPSSVTSIGNSAFSGCTGLTSITIPSSVTSIGRSTFSGCTGLTSIMIPSSVTSIDSWAFGGWTSNQTINCEVSPKPSGWKINWNGSCNAQINWNVK